MLPPLKGSDTDSGAPARLLDQESDPASSTEPAYAPTPDVETPDPTTTPDPATTPEPLPTEGDEEEDDDSGPEGRVR